MKFEVCVRHVEVQDALKSFAIERLEHAVRHIHRTEHGRLVLERHGSGHSGSEHRAHVEIFTDKGRIQSESVGPDLRQCIEKAAEKLENQIGRDHEKRGSRRAI